MMYRCTPCDATMHAPTDTPTVLCPGCDGWAVRVDKPTTPTPADYPAEELAATIETALRESLPVWWQTPPRLDWAALAVARQLLGTSVAEGAGAEPSADRRAELAAAPPAPADRAAFEALAAEWEKRGEYGDSSITDRAQELRAVLAADAAADFVPEAVAAATHARECLDRPAVIRWCANRVRSTDGDYTVQAAADYLDDLATEIDEAADAAAGVQPPTSEAHPDDIQVWPLTRVLAEVRCGSQDWTWDEEWADLDQRHAETGYLDRLEQQIRANGITMPVLIGSDGRLWDGHHRLRIAVRLGIAYVPVEITPPAAPAAPEEPQ